MNGRRFRAPWPDCAPSRLGTEDAARAAGRGDLLPASAPAAVAASAPPARQFALMAEETRTVGPDPEPCPEPDPEPGAPPAPGPAPYTPYGHLLAEDRRLRTRAAEFLGEPAGTRLSAVDTCNAERWSHAVEFLLRAGRPPPGGRRSCADTWRPGSAGAGPRPRSRPEPA